MKKEQWYEILQSDMLSSDILESQFGGVDLHILKQTDEQRVIQTIARDDDSILELSFVTFINRDAFPDIHERIVNGTSMGTAYRDVNIAFERSVRSIRRAVIPQKLQRYIPSPQPSTIIELSTFVGPKKIHYCDIIEIYSSKVHWPQPLTTSDTSVPDSLDAVSKLLA